MPRGWIQTIRLRHAAKSYARKLPRFLAEGWGGSKTYTPGQIEVAVRELKLDPSYVVLGYAQFLAEEQFDTLLDRLPVQVSYSEARELFARFMPFGSAWTPDERINPMIPGGGGN